jgi:predicted DNA-binding ribbon-helix-helix protein
MDKIKYKPLYVRLEDKSYRQLRDIAHINEISMASLVRALIDNKLKESKKVLTSSDIAI